MSGPGSGRHTRPERALLRPRQTVRQSPAAPPGVCCPAQLMSSPPPRPLLALQRWPPSIRAVKVELDVMRRGWGGPHDACCRRMATPTLLETDRPNSRRRWTVRTRLPLDVSRQCDSAGLQARTRGTSLISGEHKQGVEGDRSRVSSSHLPWPTSIHLPCSYPYSDEPCGTSSWPRVRKRKVVGVGGQTQYCCPVILAAVFLLHLQFALIPTVSGPLVTLQQTLQKLRRSAGKDNTTQFEYSLCKEVSAAEKDCRNWLLTIVSQ